MSKVGEPSREIVLPAPRTASTILSAPLWVGVCVLFFAQPGSFFSVLALCTGVIALFCLYEAAYGIFGHEIIVLTEEAVESHRRVFGVTTRRRRYRLADIRTVDVRPLPVLEWLNRSNLTDGFDEGMVVLELAEGSHRIAEGLRFDHEYSEEVAQEVREWLAGHAHR